MASTLLRRLSATALALPVTAAALLGGAAPALASGASTGSAPAAAAVPTPVTHPDADHMGSTVRAHTTSPLVARPRQLLAVSGLAGSAALSASSTPYGMDVSSFQGNVDWPIAAAGGAAFAYIKATEDTGYQNAFFAQQYNGSYAAGLIRGAYHFALPNNSSGATQATYFVDHGGGWAPDGRTLPPMLDIEYNPYGPTCYGMSTGQMSNWIRDFSTTVHARTGQYPTIYSTRDWWDTCTGHDASFAATNPLYIANYSGTPGTMPAGWGYQSIWQYADHGTFPGDADVFNGTLAQLRRFAGAPTATPAPAPAPAPTPVPVQVPSVDPLAARYAALGGAGSYLGSRLGGEYPIPGGTAQNYSGGRMYDTPTTGAKVVRGAILGDYLTLGGPTGRLGVPATDELPSPDGTGRFNHFTGSGGASIYWTPTSGAHEVQGLIRARWAALGWERSPLGYPVTDELPTPDQTGRFNHFSAGASIYWTPATGAHEVHGAIRAHWAALGWERGRLGYPTSNEYAVSGGRRSTFTGGTITWTAATNTATVAYR